MLNGRTLLIEKAIITKMVNILNEHLDFAHHFTFFNFAACIFYSSNLISRQGFS